MNAFLEWTARALRGLARLFTLALLGSLVLSLLLLGIVVALLSVLWSLLRGKRPAMFTVFRTFQQASRQFGRRRGHAAGGWSTGIPEGTPWAGATARQRDTGDVVDVQAREVHEAHAVHEVRTALGERPQP